ncbi:hypothetical protein NPIL_456391 [Nephila pilipes]|uniref:Uncharacterized protein n=1 Tax=Nephila pilipes TaxID=299642 RepID=A0A8X6U0I2_NEPPI|nr:hypothetical protein NPIL_456391 [Nephila pilipes]
MIHPTSVQFKSCLSEKPLLFLPAKSKTFILSKEGSISKEDLSPRNFIKRDDVRKLSSHQAVVQSYRKRSTNCLTPDDKKINNI